MPAQQINKNYDDIELIRKRLRSAQGARKKSGSIASLVAILPDEIKAHRTRGLTWRTIAEAILKDKSKQAAIRSAFQRLPSQTPDEAGGPPPHDSRTKPAPDPPNQDTLANERPVTTTRFSITPIVDTYGSHDNH